MKQFKNFCKDKGIDVQPQFGKKAGKLVLKDYAFAAKIYVQVTGIKYRADAILKSYGVRCVRLPPYHPELNPIGNSNNISRFDFLYLQLA